jgi:CDP-glycerol glycerophosphotransferase (TagB/SpsB family)
VLSNVSEKTDILLLSDGIEFCVYLKLANDLTNLIDDRYRIVLRPHPLERKRVYSKYPSGNVDKVVIDQNRDIYQSLSTAYAVTGEVSTALFEAVGLVKYIFLWETPKAVFSCPSHPFTGFLNAKDFVSKIDDYESGQAYVAQEEVWSQDWVSNYRSYIEFALKETHR